MTKMIAFTRTILTDMCFTYLATVKTNSSEKCQN